MKEWHCIVGGKPYGPVSEDVLKGWIAEGRLKPDDLVWTAGMPDWVHAVTVPGLFGAGPSQPTASLTGVAPPAGTGGQTPNREIMRQAREALRDRWGISIGFLLLFMLLNMGFNYIPFVGPIASIILTGPLQVGFIIFYMRVARGADTRIDVLFDGFKIFLSALCAYLLMFLLVLGWTLLLLLPGAVVGLLVGLAIGNIYGSEPGVIAGVVIGLMTGMIPGMISGAIAGLRYAMTYYLLADNPKLGPLEAIRASKQMIDGKKLKFFCLGLRFIGWALLCIPTCFIGFLWLAPYMQVSMARFYDDLRGSAAAAPATPTPTA
jgi:uncharacterized membrane protein